MISCYSGQGQGNGRAWRDGYGDHGVLGKPRPGIRLLMYAMKRSKLVDTGDTQRKENLLRFHFISLLDPIK
jgi:hypothetical protein